MAIVWSEGGLDTEVTHEGLVMETFAREVRIMSDVWDTGNFARVWAPCPFPHGTAGTVEAVLLSYAYEKSTREGCAIVDFDSSRPDYQEYLAETAAAEKRAEAKEVAAAAAQREARAEEICLHEDLSKGDRVRVIKGRKVRKGTEGTIFWTGSGSYGPRCGLKEDGAGEDDAHWTALSNLVRVLPDVPHGTVPNGGWANYLESKERTKRVAAAKNPKKGEWVALKSDNGQTYGKVFWSKEERLGFKLNPKDEAIWSNCSEVAVLTGDPRKGGVPRDPSETEAVAEKRKSGLEQMPWPYCAIKALRVEEGKWNAYDENNNFLIEMPPAAAAKVMEQLAS